MESGREAYRHEESNGMSGLAFGTPPILIATILEFGFVCGEQAMDCRSLVLLGNDGELVPLGLES